MDNLRKYGGLITSSPVMDYIKRQARWDNKRARSGGAGEGSSMPLGEANGGGRAEGPPGKKSKKGKSLV